MADKASDGSLRALNVKVHPTIPATCDQLLQHMADRGLFGSNKSEVASNIIQHFLNTHAMVGIPKPWDMVGKTACSDGK